LLAKLRSEVHVAATRQLGMIAAVELTPNGDKNERYPADMRIAYQICRAALKRGPWLRPLGDTLVIMPPLSIRQDEMAFFFEVLSAAIAEVTANPLPPEAVAAIAGDD
jgi:adenosylmethionine-8-amino-7-oxononanoate aminotransferase